MLSSPALCRQTVIKLDPNSDGNWSDAKVEKTLPTGLSKLEGHNGHQNIALDRAHRYAALPNPGDGTISLMSVESLSLLSTFLASASPSKLLAVP